MDLRIVATLVRKDVALYFRNRLFAVITVLGLVAYTVIYFILPSTVDETLTVGLLSPQVPPVLGVLATQGLVFEPYATNDALAQAIEERTVAFGVELPAGFPAALADNSTVTVYVSGEDAPEIREAYTMLVQELSNALGGQPLDFNVQSEILGDDLAGGQITLRDRMLPLFAVFIIMTEMMGLATLISAEVATGTLSALLVTPMRMTDLFAAKTVTGVVLAFSQAAILLAITGGLSNSPLLILVALLLGALLATGAAFLVASLARDMMTTLVWSIPLLLLMTIPTLVIVFPTLSARWVRVIPTYYLADTVYRASNFGSSWSAVSSNLLILLFSSLAILAVGAGVLRRAFQ